jgi:hypothetical protein
MTVRGQGNYPVGYCPERGTVSKHQLTAEKAFGGRLPISAVVHHVDYDIKNYSNENLVICPDESYHNLLHMRTDAYNACGHADWLKCYVCKEYEEPQLLLAVRKKGRRVTTFYHSACRSAYRKQYRQEKGISL